MDASAKLRATRDEPAGLTSAKDRQRARALGLKSATGLVIGTVIGAGVFTMPAVLAGAGTISLAVLAVIAVGAMVLAVLFGQLTRRIPNSDGGLYAYARHEFGDFAGYLLPPLPNHLFTRDNSCWVYGGVSVNPMAKPARQRETLHIRAVYATTPCSPAPASSPTTAATTPITCRPAWKAATCTSWATARF